MLQNLKRHQMDFPTDLPSIWKRVEAINPINYSKTRNYLDGDITFLSPYLSRGVLSTKDLFEYAIKNFSIAESYKFIQELAWREYFQEVWKAKQTLINEDLRYPQKKVSHHEIPSAIINAATGIQVIDEGIINLKESGYMHNHVRMYTAMLTCNIGQAGWLLPANWMYYHLLDGDWASNALSWQWVAGSNSVQKYYANQENINKFSKTHQEDTFIDISYEELRALENIPTQLQSIENLTLETILPKNSDFNINKELPTYIYNWYNLDSNWNETVNANRILLLEPSVFKEYPISDSSVQFMLNLAENIQDIQIFVGSFTELLRYVNKDTIHYKEHPLNLHYSGTEHQRGRIFKTEGYYPSFSKFWKQCEKELKQN